MPLNIADLREDYRLAALDISDVDKNPFVQFEKWFQEAVNSAILEPNAMVLATISRGNTPSARVVLLKGVQNPEDKDADLSAGFVFFTNYESRKGQELATYAHAALCFNWLDLQRQVRIEGSVKKVSEQQSDAYFESRPFKSQVGAWASPQSQIIENRAILTENMEKITQKYENTEGVPRPPHWGGYIVEPTMIEFWQGRRSRLHDRICYVKMPDGAWKIERLAP